MMCGYWFNDQEDEETRKEIIVKVNGLTKTYPEASRYLNYMRRIFKEGSVVIIQELSLIKQRLQSSKPGSKESVSVSMDDLQK